MSAPGILFPVPRIGILPAAAMKAFFWQPGGTTKQNTFSDPDLAIGHLNLNPLVADGAGLFPAVYLDPALGYKVALYPSTEVNDPPTGTAYLTQDNAYLPSMLLPQVLSTKVGNYAVVTGDGFDVLILCDATTGSFTVSPYTAVGNTGKKITVVKIDSSANTVTIDPSGTQKWGGAATLVLTAQFQASTGESDNANWQVIGKALTVLDKVVQIVAATCATIASSSSATYADTGLTATITPTSAANKILVLVQQTGLRKDTGNVYMQLRLMRAAAQLALIEAEAAYTNSAATNYVGGTGINYLDAPATVAATTYKTQFASGTGAASVSVQDASSTSSIVLIEVTP